ncbi:hypothetical protein [Alkalihalobacterium sp. APHAB7]|uniref:hypothetical protein n=1 Tax=Alkalihalobacterium sp. APHAB7 TaxID=3402081 RepID=UPI003AAC2B68
MLNENKEDMAHHFIQLHLKSLPITNETIEKVIDGTAIRVITNKTPLRREADVQVKLDDTYETLRFLSPNLHITSAFIKAQLANFVYHNKAELEKMFNDII